MILWTSQEEAVYNELLKTGVYRCDFNLSSMRDCRKQYDWLVRQMKQRIGPPPDKVTYPVWALYQQDGKHRNARKPIALIGLNKTALYLRQALLIIDIICQHHTVAHAPLIEEIENLRIIVIAVAVTAKNQHFFFFVERRQYSLVIVKHIVAVF